MVHLDLVSCMVSLDVVLIQSETRLNIITIFYHFATYVYVILIFIIICRPVHRGGASAPTFFEENMVSAPPF